MAHKNTLHTDKRLSRFPAWPGKVVRFYADGFRNMTVGKKLWLLIIIK
ncbi:MAG: DUF4492 domain-containing protein, partial [Duncaniella sp.]|nr:DUF4492 domain-containing protein [Duncaniella sp.]